MPLQSELPFREDFLDTLNTRQSRTLLALYCGAPFRLARLLGGYNDDLTALQDIVPTYLALQSAETLFNSAH